MFAATNQTQVIDEHADGAVGRVERLLYGPVKGLGLASPHSVNVTATGLEGDRRFFLADQNDTLLSITRTGALTGLSASWDPAGERLTVTGPSGTEFADTVDPGEAVEVNFFGHHHVRGRVVEGRWAQFFSDHVGQPVRLVRVDVANAACDLHPVTLLGDASVQALAEHADTSIDSRRFRMSIEFSGFAPFAEDEWSGRLLSAGDAELRVGGPVKRCAATAREPESGQRDLPMLRMLKAMRGLQPSELGTGVNFGVYAHVVRPGRVSVGDQIRLVTDDGA